MTKIKERVHRTQMRPLQAKINIKEIFFTNRAA
jgi:hypothetical protein